MDNKPLPISCCFLVQLKAFGDFVIALHSLRSVQGPAAGSTHLRLLAGQHLRDLARALGVEREVTFVPSGNEYPAAYDFKRKGLFRGLASLLELRSSLRGLPRDCQLVFDEHGKWRTRFIGGGYRRSVLGPAPNVYLARAKSLRTLGFDVPELPAGAGATPQRVSPRLVRIFPSSRKDDKSVPAAVTTRFVEQLLQAGVTCEVIELAGEGYPLPAGLPVRHLERNFGALIDAVRGSSLVVTADSLPGHLAEYFQLPAYVITPRENSYWLPLSSFNDQAWSLFEDDQSFPRWLSRRIDGA